MGFHIAWILSSLDHHMTATDFFDEIFRRHTTSSDIVYTLGRVGLHKVVAASIAHNTTSQNPAVDIVDTLVKDFPSIRAAFLVSADATAPRNGFARIGDVIVGRGSGTKAGVVYFDHQETTKQKRLFITSEPRPLPGAVSTATEDMWSQKCRNDWLWRLEHHGPTKIRPRSTACMGASGELNTDDAILEPALKYQLQGGSTLQRQPKALGGLIASSEQMLKDSALIDSLAASNNILCFETAAANMKSRQLMILSGIARCSGDEQQELSSNEVCQVVASYLTSLVYMIDATKLATESPIANSFRYEALDLDSPAFRLLQLEPGTGQIECHVFQAYLDDETNLIPYEALSYCWGSTRLARKVKVNGRDLFITENLYEALQHLRPEGEARILWIDAICIDQSNIRERGHQVRYMSRIYSGADRVVIWLGYVKIESEHTLSALREFEKRVPPRAWNGWHYDDPEWSKVWKDAQTYLLGGHGSDEIGRQSGLRFLMKQPWFTRVWILQEAAKAKKARIVCSGGWIRAESFALAPRLLRVMPNTRCQAIIDIMPGPSRRSSWWTQKQNLCTLLWKFRESQAHDPRDRVFALLDLASDMEVEKKITADYTKNEEAVVKDVLAYLFNDDPSPNGFIVREIADLQMRIPNLSCMALERMILRGAQIKQIQDFLQLQTETVWLSEAAASYAWCMDTTLADYLLNEPTFRHIAIGSVHETTVLESTVTVESFLDRRTNKLKATWHTIETARLQGVDLLARVVEENRDDIEITEAFLEEATRRGSDRFKLLLDRRGKDVKVSENIIKSAYSHDIDLLALVVKEGRNDIEITEALAEEAARRGSDILRLLLDTRGDQVKTTEGIISAAALGGSDTLKLLLDRRGNEVKVSRDVIRIAHEHDIDLLALVVEEGRNDIEITKALAEEAAQRGSDILRLLLDTRGDEVKINEAIVTQAAFGGSDTFKLLLDRRGNEIEITEAIIFAAASRGFNTLKVLLDTRGNEVVITEDIITAAVFGGSDTLKLLLDRRGNEIEITEAIFSAAAMEGSDTLKVLLDSHGNGIEITEATISAAASRGSDILKVLLDSCGNKVKITEAIVEKAAFGGSDTLKVLLDSCGNEVKITEAIVKKAAFGGSDTLKLLLDRRGNEIEITEAIISAAASRGSDTLKVLLNRYGNKIEISEAIVKAAARKGVDISKLLEKEPLVNRWLILWKTSGLPMVFNFISRILHKYS
ncbi:unnamed protein product [Clonostachys rosea]|uniref:Heterokaryon incompatibility domain-containing protein n=1 Tax=Bionectria ochroleuca TaxID=29856 RepID=A0ABY6TXH5_BIOOC|nr:unnamed protein product [Clonostachys rosea]